MAHSVRISFENIWRLQTAARQNPVSQTVSQSVSVRFAWVFGIICSFNVLDYIIKFPPVPSRFVIRNPSLLATFVRPSLCATAARRCIAVALTCIVINLVRSLVSSWIRLAGFSVCRHRISRDYSQLRGGYTLCPVRSIALLLIGMALSRRTSLDVFVVSLKWQQSNAIV